MAGDGGMHMRAPSAAPATETERTRRLRDWAARLAAGFGAVCLGFAFAALVAVLSANRGIGEGYEAAAGPNNAEVLGLTALLAAVLAAALGLPVSGREAPPQRGRVAGTGLALVLFGLAVGTLAIFMQIGHLGPE